jgi:hypothetical protein
VRKASVASQVKLARKRESAEREGNLSRETLGHEGLCKRQEVLIERLQRAFAADGVAKEDSKKIDDLVVSETAGQAHLRTDGRKHALLVKIGDE